MIPRTPLFAIPSAFLLLLVACADKHTTVIAAPIAARPAPPKCPDGFDWNGERCAEPLVDPPPRSPSYPQAFEQKSGLVRIHFPSDLVVQADSDNLTFLDPASTSSVSAKSLVTFTTNPDPISQNPDEYAAVLQGARQKALTGYTLLSTTPGRCFRNVRGVETRWEFAEGTTMMRGRACAFVHHHHGYSFMYAFDPQRPKDEPYLRSVIEAVEVTD